MIPYRSNYWIIESPVSKIFSLLFLITQGYRLLADDYGFNKMYALSMKENSCLHAAYISSLIHSNSLLGAGKYVGSIDSLYEVWHAVGTHGFTFE